MKVLSLFDGMACGMIAMQLAGMEVESYDAYEIDKYAIKTAQHNFPMIKEHGDVFEANFTQYEGVDFLIGGSPCTYWSIAQTKNRETVASGLGWELFSQYVRALREAKPKYFIYENNKSMSKAIRASIDETFGFEAVLINSALVSTQNRQRLYWVGKRNEDGTYSKVLVEQPEDRGILLRDILETGVCWRDKSYTLDANYYKGGNLTSIEKQSGHRLMVAEPLIATPDGKGVTLCGNGGGLGAKTGLYAVPITQTKDGKSFSITANYANMPEFPNDYSAHSIEKSVKPVAAVPYVGQVTGSKIYEVKDGLITIKGKQYPIKLKDGYYIIRKLTVRECMRLQTVPEWYEFPVSDSQAYKMLGNGWTCEVIAHILKSLKEA